MQISVCKCCFCFLKTNKPERGGVTVQLLAGETLIKTVIIPLSTHRAPSIGEKLIKAGCVFLKSLIVYKVPENEGAYEALGAEHETGSAGCEDAGKKVR